MSMPQTGSLAMLDHFPSAPGVSGTVRCFPVTRDRLPAQRLDERLCMHQQVLGVLLEDVLAGLRTNLADKRLKQVNGHCVLAALERLLGRVELGDETASYSSVVDMAKL